MLSSVSLPRGLPSVRLVGGVADVPGSFPFLSYCDTTDDKLWMVHDLGKSSLGEYDVRMRFTREQGTSRNFIESMAIRRSAA